MIAYTNQSVRITGLRARLEITQQLELAFAVPREQFLPVGCLVPFEYHGSVRHFDMLSLPSHIVPVVLVRRVVVDELHSAIRSFNTKGWLVKVHVPIDF